MSEVYLIVLAVLLIGMICQALASSSRLYEYPYFMCAAFTVFILPQGFALVRAPAPASQAGVEAALLMTILCVLACILGYRGRPTKWIVEKASVPVDDRRLFHCGMLFIMCGFVFTWKIGQMSDEARGGSMWTGIVTIYLFFASLTFPGFSICLRQALRKGGLAPWMWSAAGAAIPVISVVFYGRREPAVLFVVTVGITLFFERGLAVPKIPAALAIIGSMLAIPATTSYRQAMIGGEGFADVKRIDLIGNFEHYMSGAEMLELRNAAMLIEAKQSVGDYGWGTAYWDQLVFRFVPAQILGKEFKYGLMFGTSDEHFQQEIASRGFHIATGSTVTGMADSFQQFGYFGALYFAAIAVLFKSLWVASRTHNAPIAQLFYIQTSTSAMRAITHQTVDCLPGLVYNLIFLGLAAMYARSHAPQAAPRQVTAKA